METQTQKRTFTSMEKSHDEAGRRLERKVSNFVSERGPGFCRRLISEEPTDISRDGNWYRGSKVIAYEEIRFVAGSYFDQIINAQ